ncbi:unnamed protein product [Strongylus vulgaris]|uniref:Uncharacterized protein n=1 Tax=Strongylus vulgaris TaxID=40348 RepID=A0A3P7IP06_STRVU|nr:unnamed protein product [Strongylus vulgaris]
MAVALAPVPKIDYSVTKGGARTWAVLLVFLFLCSGLYTIFSSKEINEDTSVPNEQQDEIGDDSQSYSDLTPKERRNIKEEQDEEIEEEALGVDLQQTDDDEEEVEPPLEDQLFAGLRKKIENNIQRVKDFVKCPQRRRRKGECVEESEKEETESEDTNVKEEEEEDNGEEEEPPEKTVEEEEPTKEDDDSEKDEKSDHGRSKVEGRLGRKQRSYGARGSGRDTYKRQAITNRDDHRNREALDRADSLVEKVKLKRFKKSKKSDSL